jgi:DNA-binding winged helix-turn-helix (wHTH) protein/tetratricopeptide (TPR) repeat protein
MSFDKVPNFLVNLFGAEMNGSEPPSYRFKSFVLNISERRLSQNEKAVPLTPKAFDVLTYLVERGGHLVLKDELMQAVWPDSFVDEVNLPRTIHTLRSALGEDKNGNKFIETVPTKGYRFVAEILAELPASAGGRENAALDTMSEISTDDAEHSSENQSPLTSSFTPPAYAGDSALTENISSTVSERSHPTRIVLFTVGFATAISLILLLSFNFRQASSPPPQQSTTNEEAYRLYLHGAFLAEKITPDDAKKAIEAFEQALAQDPNYAPAYAGLANVHNSIAFMGGGSNTTEEYLKAKTAVEKALAIDPNLAEAHSYLGEIKTNFEWDFAGAEREHKRAIELNPNSAAARRMYSLLLGYLGRADDSIAESRTAIDLEPNTILNHKIYQQNLYYARRYDEAIAEGKRTLEIDPEFLGVYDTVIGAYLMKGDGDDAFEWFLKQKQHKQDKPDEIESWKSIYTRSGWPGFVERQLELAKEAEKNGDTNPMPLARLYAKTGDIEQAFVYLEKAYEKRLQGMISLKVSPSFDPLHSDRRFDALVKRIGLK